MSSAVCHNFVQNAWRKELCSNCFKSKNEHVERVKPLPLLVTSKKIESIIKVGKKKRKHRVQFLNQLTQIIGYGGEDWSTDEEDITNTTEEENVTVSEDEVDKELQRLTKANTDFNTSSLNEDNPKKSYASLMLGKPLLDAEGNKKTLLVSVTPFGENSNSKKPTKFTTHNFISKNNKDLMLTETKSNVILTSYAKNNAEPSIKEEKSLLEEISETLENSKNPIEIISRKKFQTDIILFMPSTQSNDKENNQKNSIHTELSGTERKNCPTKLPLSKIIENSENYQTTPIKTNLMNETNTHKNSENNEASVNHLGEKNKEVFINTISPNVIKKNILNGYKTSKWDTTLDDAEFVIKGQLPEMSADSKLICGNVPQSRELAGEPDGRADSDNSEPPPLPLTQPPVLEGQHSFLHASIPPYLKPKIPTKPSTVAIRKTIVPNQNNEIKNKVLSTFVADPKNNDDHSKLQKQDSNNSEASITIANKRKAPKPPEENGRIYARHFINSTSTDTPVAKEKEKRDTASLNSLQIRNSLHDNSTSYYGRFPEPAPRKSLSMSSESLFLNEHEDKRKEKTKSKFSLKKFLRMGSNKDLTKIPPEGEGSGDMDLTPQPKPRLVIIHPTDLNRDSVDPPSKTSIGTNDFKTNDIDYSTTHRSQYFPIRKTNKPPPPPRQNDTHVLNPLPKSAQIMNAHKLPKVNSFRKKHESVYANLGEVRSAIMPNKPVRTASMREAETQHKNEKQTSSSYELMNNCSDAKMENENIYDYINNTRSSSPDSDSSREKHNPSKIDAFNKRSESSIDVSGDYFKYNNIPRSVSLTYCGSETESEIYSPYYSFYGSESEIAEDDRECIQNGRTHKLRSRKGRSIVHKNLEDNYGAVIVANHEALAQVLENIQQMVHIQPALRGLKNLTNLRWTDLAVNSSSAVCVGKRSFLQALWGSHHVTLLINTDLTPASTLSLGSFSLNLITEFNDLVPVKYLAQNMSSELQVQALISVLPWMQMNTLQTYNESLKSKMGTRSEECVKESIFIMLQLVNALKALQAQGIEELSLALNSFILCRDMEKDGFQKLCVLQGVNEELNCKAETKKFGTLCHCATKALNILQLPNKISTLLQSLLSNERAVSLTQVKSVLEFSLWGPSDVALGSTVRDRELALQHWLDLQRATVLHGLVCTKVQLTVYEECHLLFLVRSNARMMCDASLLLESSNIRRDSPHK